MGNKGGSAADKGDGGKKTRGKKRMDTPIQLAHFDRALALDRVGGDEELLREVAQLFLREWPSMMGQIRDAVSTGNALRVMEVAHTMKGSLSTIGAENGAQTALILETMGRREALEGSADALIRLEASLSILQKELHLVIA